MYKAGLLPGGVERQTEKVINFSEYMLEMSAKRVVDMV